MDVSLERWNLCWAAERSVRYHESREGFFDSFRIAADVTGALFATAAAGTVLASMPKEIAGTLAVIAAAIAVLDVVVGPSTAARKHLDLRRRWLELQKEIDRTLAPTVEQILAWKNLRSDIEADEPPVFVALDVLCHIELARAKRKPLPPRPPRFICWTAHLFRWSSYDFQDAPPTHPTTSPTSPP